MNDFETNNSIDKVPDQQPGWYESNMLLYAIAAFGVLVRLVQYLYCRNLWIDEAMVALNIVGKSYGQLCGTLDHFQVVPTGLLLFSKLAVEFLGNNEYVLRLLPFIAGVGANFLLLKLAKSIICPKALPAAMILFACSYHLIYYSNELKQYSCDCAASLIVLVFTIQILKKGISPLKLVLFGLTGAMLVWFSSSSVFTLASAGLVLSFRFLCRKDYKKLTSLAIAFIPWAISFVAAYTVLNNNENVHTQRALTLWKPYFAPLPPTSMSDMFWYKNMFEQCFDNPGGFTSSIPIVIICFLFGYFSVWKKDKSVFWLLVLPVVFSLLASGLKIYPFQGRVLLYIVPLMILGIAQGLENVRRKLACAWRPAGIIVLLLVLFFPALKAVKLIFRPFTRHELTEAMEYLNDNRRPDDLIHLYRSATRSYAYYAERYGLADVPYIEGTLGRDKFDDRVQQLEKYSEDYDKLRGNDRVWFFFCGHQRKSPVDKLKFSLFYLDRIGNRLDEFHAGTSSLYLYDLSEDKKPDSEDL